MKSELITERDFVGPARLWGNKPSTARDADGNLWFATLNGVFHIDPRHLNADIHPPILSIRSAVKHGVSVRTEFAQTRSAFRSSTPGFCYRRWRGATK